MSQEERKCLITGLPAEADARTGDFQELRVPEAGISYHISGTLESVLSANLTSLDEADKIKLAYHILKANRAGEKYPVLHEIFPEISHKSVQVIKALPRPSIDERTQSYLQWVYDETGGDLSKGAGDSRNYAGMIAGCAMNADEQRLFVWELRDEGYVKAADGAYPMYIKLTLEGLRYCEELQKGSEASQPVAKQEEGDRASFVWNRFGILANSRENRTYLYIVNQNEEERKISTSAYSGSIPELKKKIEALKGKPVSVRTSQNTAKWPPNKWFSDIKEHSEEIFVAMWFDKEMNGFYEHIKKELEGAEEYGFKVIRIDQKEHNNKIDDEIIKSLKSCDLVIADFTCGDGGEAHRGGVYYEAGFAHGLNKNVIFTVRQDCVDGLHFDTRQYNHIVWEKQDDNFVATGDGESKPLAQAILNRIKTIKA